MNEARSAMTINIGKAGVNDNVIEEIKRQLKSNPIIKLRFAKNVARNKDDLISNIVEGTKSQLIDVRGNVAVGPFIYFRVGKNNLIRLFT